MLEKVHTSSQPALDKPVLEALKEAEKPSVPTAQEVINDGYADLLIGGSGPPTPGGPQPKSKRSTNKTPKPRAGKAPSASEVPLPDEAVQRLNKALNGDENRPIFIIKKQLHLYFTRLPHRLSYYFPDGCPDTSRMSFMQLEDLKKQVEFVLNDGDEEALVKQGFIIGAGFIEDNGPQLHRVMHRYIRGTEMFASQQGLRSVISEAVNVPGEQGLGDEVAMTAVSMCGLLPQSNLLTGVGKLYNIMVQVQKANEHRLFERQNELGANAGTQPQERPVSSL